MIRLLDTFEKQNSRNIYEKSFTEDSKAYVDYYYNHRINDNEVVVYEKDGKIVSAMHLIPKNIIFGEKKSEAKYIYAVSTLEEYRKKGYSSQIFKEVLKEMYDNAEAFTYLIPSDEQVAGVYRKLGFEYVMDKKELIADNRRKKPSNAFMIRKAENSDLLKLSIFAQSALYDRYSITLEKTIDYFKNMQELAAHCGGKIEIFTERKVIVGYRIWLEDELIEEVLDGEIQNLCWLAGSSKPYLMLRIVNVEKFLQGLKFREFSSFIIRIKDEIISENNGTFKFAYRAGNVKITKIDDNNGIKPDYEMTIDEFTACIFGKGAVEEFPMWCSTNGVFINDYV